jgi:para-nitrobenzyl esterase
MHFRIPVRAFTMVLAGLLSAAGIGNSHDVQAAVDTTAVVATDSGRVRGAIGATTITFLGIPYAEAPLGERRWRPPVVRARSQGVLDAFQFGKHCPQPGTSVDSNASEDCLFLNVYVPRGPDGEISPQAKRPVMVWIHGGANASGASEMYGPTPMLDTGGVIVVTLNDRLGALGFLAHPAFYVESGTTGNWGLMDQQMALRWVQANIAAFGGDPGNVTLFGESAGGLDAINHLVSPLSAGRFARVILQSAAYQLITPSLATSETLAASFAEHVGCSDQTAACLRSKSTIDVLANSSNAYNQATVDGPVLPRTQLEALSTGHFNKVPVVQGANSHEGRFFIPPTLTKAGYQAFVAPAIAAATGKTVDQILVAYPANDDASAFEAASAAFGDVSFACTALVANNLLSESVPTYAYEFDDPAASALGAMHTAELKYLFNLNLGGQVVGPASLPVQSQMLADTMRRYWTNFARSSTPNGTGLPEWNPVSDQRVQRLIAPVPISESIGDYAAQHQCAFWA